jgi:hypothetical protein
MVSNKCDVMSPHIFAMGLKDNTEEHLKIREAGCKVPNRWLGALGYLLVF